MGKAARWKRGLNSHISELSADFMALLKLNEEEKKSPRPLEGRVTPPITPRTPREAREDPMDLDEALPVSQRELGDTAPSLLSVPSSHPANDEWMGPCSPARPSILNAPKKLKRPLPIEQATEDRQYKRARRLFPEQPKTETPDDRESEPTPPSQAASTDDFS